MTANKKIRITGYVSYDQENDSTWGCGRKVKEECKC